jgi:outer membrane translocation and assembly module TamA
MTTLKLAAKKQKTSMKSSPSNVVCNTTADADDGQPSQNAQERPLGKKKEKQKL